MGSSLIGRSWRGGSAATLAVLALGGCGGGGLSAQKTSVVITPTAPPPSVPVVSAVPPHKKPTLDLHIALRPIAPAHGSGSARVRVFYKLNEICWSFSALKGAPNPVSAGILLKTANGGQPLIEFGSQYRPNGCITGGSQMTPALVELARVASQHVLVDFECRA
jgi:hypothetical protein